MTDNKGIQGVEPIDVNIVEMPSFDICEDHPMHRKAKLQKLKGRMSKPRKPELLTYTARVVTCPECGVTFDSNIVIEKLTKE